MKKLSNVSIKYADSMVVVRIIDYKFIFVNIMIASTNYALTIKYYVIK